MKTPNKSPGDKNKPAKTNVEIPAKKKQPEIDNNDELDIDSTTADPTKPDEETSHRKKHKIGFDKSEEPEKTDPTKPDEETSHKKKHKIGFKTGKK